MLRIQGSHAMILAVLSGILTLALVLSGGVVNPWITMTAGMVTLLLIVGGVYSSRREVAGWFSGRQARFGAYSTILVLVVAAILGLLNFIANRHPVRWDVTSAGQFTLSEQTRQILETLPGQVEVIICYRKSDPASAERRFELEDLLKEYAYQSGNRLSYRMVDPERNPAEAQELDITTETTIVRCQGRETRLTGTGEEELTNALLKVLSATTKSVCFLEGHGGRDPGDESSSGFGLAARALEQENYEVTATSLIMTGSVPGSCDVLVLAGLEGDLLAGEVEMIDGYLRGGGACLILADPPGSAGRPNLDSFLEDFGIQPGNDLVVDPLSQALFGDARIPVGAAYADHEITDGFSIISYFPVAQSMNAADSPARPASGPEPVELILSSAESFGENGWEELEFNEGEDSPGPVSLAAAIELPPEFGVETTAVTPASSEDPPVADDPAADPAAADIPPGGDPPALDEETGDALPGDGPGGRLVVFGDSDFASNSYFPEPGNGNLFLNAVNWLSGEEKLISIRPRVAGVSTVSVTRLQSRLILLVAVVALPLTLLLFGITVWRRRRRL